MVSITIAHTTFQLFFLVTSHKIADQRNPKDKHTLDRSKRQHVHSLKVATQKFLAFAGSFRMGLVRNMFCVSLCSVRQNLDKEVNSEVEWWISTLDVKMGRTWQMPQRGPVNEVCRHLNNSVGGNLGQVHFGPSVAILISAPATTFFPDHNQPNGTNADTAATNTQRHCRHQSQARHTPRKIQRD